jgi:RNA polymerase sigma factor (sigma-70 family)
MNLDNNFIISDEDLLNDCLAGNQEAWGNFYERFTRLISSVIKGTASRYGMNLSPEDLKDCEQFIWTSFFEKDFDKLRKWQKKCSLATWLKVCSCNATINYLNSYRRKAWRQTIYDDQCALTFIDKDCLEINSEKEVTQQEVLKKIAQIINKNLSDRERLFSNLYWYDELSFNEISKIMHISKHNLYLIRHRIIKKIKRLFNE